MQRLERLFLQVCTSKQYTKLIPSSMKYSTAGETLDASKSKVPENQHEFQNSNEETQLNDTDDAKRSGFAKAFDRQANFDTNQSESNEKSASFATLLRQSNLMHLGDPEGKVVIGEIMHVVKNDLYIDFGWKFHCVCPKPTKSNSDYVRGAKVTLKIKDLEMSTKFLGSTKDVTLLEADCVMLSLLWSPNRIHKTVDNSNNE